ncbi:unnamed protein product, partial [Symbiodinium sp. CCMP2592]
MDANSEEYATKVWCSNNRAPWFLIWLGLLCLPRQCSRGHNWKFSNNKDGAYCHLHCTAKLDEVYPVSDEEDEEEKAPVHKRCNYRKSWRDHGFFHYYLPCSLTPAKYLRALYWFSDAPQKQILKETGLKIKVWAQIRNRLRALLWLVMQTHAGRVQLGGQADRVVVVDETFFTKKKVNAGGFVGRTTLGHKTIVMGFLELQLSTRKATGACVLIEIPNRKQATLKREIQRHVAPGSLIFTDRHKSYHFLSRPNKDVVVTTNSVEGLFGRLKQYLRQRKYGKVQNPFSVDDIPVDILNDFQSLLDDPEDVPADRGDGVSPSENVPAHDGRDASPQRPAPPLMQAAAEPSQPPAFKPPSPSIPCNVKAEASSDSDLEVLYIKPAPKRPRRSSDPVVPVKLEEDASRCAQLPLATSSTGAGSKVSKDVKVFCQQGHDLKLVPPPANVILNQSEYAYFN